MKNNKKTLKFVLLILILIILFLVIRSTYSKYITSADNEATLHISKWNILLNDKDISENKDFTQDLTVTFDKNENIADDVIAPTKTGYFEINLESTGTELPFKYQLQIADIKTSYSNYVLSLDNVTPVGASYNYNFTITFKDNDTQGPIYYYDDSNDLVYNKLPIIFNVPDGFTLDTTNITWAETISQNNNTIGIIPLYSAWNPDTNTLTQKISFTNNTMIDIDVQNFLTNVSYNGKPLSETAVPDYKIYAYSINEKEIINLNTDEKIIKGIIEPPKDVDGNFTGEEVKNLFKLYVQWYDETDNILNNKDDVKASKIDGATATIPIELKITQVNS